MTTSKRSGWSELREQRMNEPEAREGYQAAKLAHELGRSIRELRTQRGWTQNQLATAAGMTQPAVARFEAGGTIPSLLVLDRLAAAIDADLTVQLTPRGHAA